MLLGSLRPLGPSSSLPAGFPSVPSDSAYSASLFVSFRASLFRSHSRSTGACLPSGSFRPLSSGIRPVPLRFLSSAPAFRSPLLSCIALPFRCFPFPPRASFLGAPSLLSSLRFPLPPRLVSHPFSPVLLTWFSASFPFVLPNFTPAAVPLVLVPLSPSFPPVPSSRFPLPSLSFVRSGLGSDYSASVSSFPFFPASPLGGSFRCCPLPFVSSVPLPYPLDLPPVSMRPILLWYSAFLRFLSTSRFASQGLLFAIPPALSGLASSPGFLLPFVRFLPSVLSIWPCECTFKTEHRNISSAFFQQHRASALVKLSVY